MASNSVEIWGFYGGSIGLILRPLIRKSPANLVCQMIAEVWALFASKSQIFNFANNWHGCHFVYNFFLFFWKFFLQSFKNFQNIIKDCILPIQNDSDFHMKMFIFNSQAFFNVNFSFEYSNNFDWFRQAVISTMIHSHFRSWMFWQFQSLLSENTEKVIWRFWKMPNTQII